MGASEARPIVARGLVDPWHSIIGKPKPLRLKPDRAALVVIDMQNYTADQSGWMGRVAVSRGQGDALEERWRNVNAILDPIAMLQAVFRETHSEVIHVRVAHLTRNLRDGNRGRPTKLSKLPLVPSDDEFVPAVGPVGDEIVLSKTTNSVFNSTVIDMVLRNLGIDQLVVTGIVTQGCVELSARDAADRGYQVAVISDACASSTVALHEDALSRMNRTRLIAIRESREVAAELKVGTE